MALVDDAAIQRVRVAAEKLGKAKKDYHTAVCIAFPKGSVVQFYRGGALIEAEVLRVSNNWWSSPRVKFGLIDRELVLGYLHSRGQGTQESGSGVLTGRSPTLRS